MRYIFILFFILFSKSIADNKNIFASIGYSAIKGAYDHYGEYYIYSSDGTVVDEYNPYKEKSKALEIRFGTYITQKHRIYTNIGFDLDSANKYAGINYDFIFDKVYQIQPYIGTGVTRFMTEHSNTRITIINIGLIYNIFKNIDVDVNANLKEGRYDGIIGSTTLSLNYIF